jgi:hypothetical protein
MTWIPLLLVALILTGQVVASVVIKIASAPLSYAGVTATLSARTT